MHQIEYDYRRGDFKSVILSIPLALKSRQELAFDTEHYVELYLKSWQLHADLQSLSAVAQESEAAVPAKAASADLALFQEHWGWIESHCPVSVKLKTQSVLVLINCFHQYQLAKEKCLAMLDSFALGVHEKSPMSDLRGLVELLALYIYPTCQEFDKSREILSKFACHYSREQIDIWQARIREKQQRCQQASSHSPRLKEVRGPTGFDRDKMRQLLLYYGQLAKKHPFRSLMLLVLATLVSIYFLFRRLSKK